MAILNGRLACTEINNDGQTCAEKSRQSWLSKRIFEWECNTQQGMQWQNILYACPRKYTGIMYSLLGPNSHHDSSHNNAEEVYPKRGTESLSRRTGSGEIGRIRATEQFDVSEVRMRILGWWPRYVIPCSKNLSV